MLFGGLSLVTRAAEECDTAHARTFPFTRLSPLYNDVFMCQLMLLVLYFIHYDDNCFLSDTIDEKS